MTGHRQKASKEWKVGSIEQACHNPPQKQHRCVEEAATCRNTIMIVSIVSMLASALLGMGFLPIPACDSHL